MTEYAKPEVLVETDGLEEHVGAPGVRIIEVDEDSAAYEKGHIEGAVGWNWSTDLHAKVVRDYLSRVDLSDLLSRAGVGEDTTVVLYGGNNNWFAAYAYWILKLRGFDAVKLLNGGGGEYGGEKLAPDHLPQEQAQVPGHIAGAANIPWAKAANEDGTFKSADELKALYEAEGITGEGEIIAYGRIGERSSHTWFALQELLGYGNVKNYDGSWTEYGSLVGVPVEMGGRGFAG